MRGGGVALVRAQRAIRALAGATPDRDSGLRIVERALEEPLRRIVENAGDEPSVVLRKVAENPEPAFGCNAATRAYGDLPATGVIDPAKVTRLALQNAASIAALILTTDCMIAGAPAPATAATAGGGAAPGFRAGRTGLSYGFAFNALTALLRLALRQHGLRLRASLSH